MREGLPGFYPPAENDFYQLWESGLFVFDTNVLLNLYKYPDRAREDSFRVLDRLAAEQRLWIPFQVALEYQANRTNVIAGQLKRFSQISAAICTAVADVEGFELEKREPTSEPLVQRYKSAAQSICDLLKELESRHVQISGEDEIRLRLDNVFDGAIGPKPASQAELDAIYKLGEKRYENLTPPGYAYRAKAKDPKDAQYGYAGLVFQRQYGDLLIWLQLISHAKERKITHLVFVTGDRKEDWWLHHSGKAIGPQPSLIEEILREAGVSVFHMYTMERFLEQARSYLKLDVRDESIADVKQVADLSADRTYVTSTGRAFEDTALWGPSEDAAAAQRAVFKWLMKRYPGCLVQPGMDATFLVQEAGLVQHAFDIWLPKSAPLDEAELQRRLRWGRSLMSKPLIREFTLVVVLRSDVVSEISQRRGAAQFNHALQELVRDEVGTNVIVGTVTNDMFNVVWATLLTY